MYATADVKGEDRDEFKWKGGKVNHEFKKGNPSLICEKSNAHHRASFGKEGFTKGRALTRRIGRKKSVCV